MGCLNAFTKTLREKLRIIFITCLPAFAETYEQEEQNIKMLDGCHINFIQGRIYVQHYTFDSVINLLLGDAVRSGKTGTFSALEPPKR